jgi:hypothetical protein
VAVTKKTEKTPAKKSAADVLREALAAKKAGSGTAGPKPRAELGGGKVRKDAERIAGKSRKVH